MTILIILGHILSGLISTYVFLYYHYKEFKNIDTSCISFSMYMIVCGYYALLAVILLSLGVLIHNKLKKYGVFNPLISKLNYHFCAKINKNEECREKSVG